MHRKVIHIIDSMWLWWAQTIVKWIFEKQHNNRDIFLYALRKRDINVEVKHPNIFLYNSKNKFSFPIFQLRRFILENKIEILHCHLAKSQILWWILKFFFFPNIKLIFHEHWEIFEQWRLYPFLMNLFKKQVNIYVAISQATKQKILWKTFYKEEKIKILYNFVDCDIFKKIDKNIFTQQNRNFVIWFAWRFIERKWWKVFLEAAKKMWEKWYNIEFLLAWDGQDRKQIDTYIKSNNLNNKVKVLWYTQKMVEFYNMLDVFIFPSNWEPLWLTWIEANACQTPVIASNIEWLNEIMIDGVNALLFEVWDVNSLVSKIEIIYNDTHLKQLLIKNWLQKSEEYSLNRYLLNLEKIYDRI
jgi:glycosyltransferase involved in cell wall biosynthesis